MADSYKRKESGNAYPFKVSFLTLLLYLLAGSLLLLTLNIKVLMSVLLNSTTGSVNQAGLEPYTKNLTDFLGKLNRPVLMLVWAAFGAVVYGIVWFGQNVLFTAQRQAEESHYLRG